ncbi:hypothetical protein [Rhodopseudomonas pseudopalustris]|nr:hypothetical protein [Rhodopseudomonas pseudopalustris]MBB1091882.1 hypothetical protein [Rhodopseudomonas palustris]
MADPLLPALFLIACNAQMQIAPGEPFMLEMYVMLQLVRSPLQAMARLLMCKSLSVATSGRLRCCSCTGVTTPELD